VSDKEVLTPRGLERRIKRYCAGTTQQFLAIPTPCFEPVLAEEIRSSGIASISQSVTGGVEFSAPFEYVYTANTTLRSANRILLRMASFTVRSYPELFNKMKRVSWELYCGFSGAFSLSVSSSHSRLHHTENIRRSVTDAIIGYMHGLGVTTSYDEKAPVQFFIRFADDECTVSIDSSGQLLYKRGYRLNTAHAPIRETIAASLLIESQWEKYSWILDPFCGSGTFLIEAALLAMNMPAAVRRQFAFQAWGAFSDIQMRRSAENALKQVRPAGKIDLQGSDISVQAIAASKENASNAGVGEMISFSVADCFKTSNSFNTENGLIISNLPYGKRARVRDASMELFFQRLSKHMKQNFHGSHFTFVTDYPVFEDVCGFRVKRVLPFTNGGIEVNAYFGKIV
jgi:putative N6-adenine-specific DNA methylase